MCRIEEQVRCAPLVTTTARAVAALPPHGCTADKNKYMVAEDCHHSQGSVCSTGCERTMYIREITKDDCHHPLGVVADKRIIDTYCGGSTYAESV